MKLSWLSGIILGGLSGLMAPLAAVPDPDKNVDFTGDTQPDIVWRRKAMADTHIWKMNSYSYGQQATQVGWSGTDTNWKIVGTGDFGTSASNSTPDQKPDLLWMHTVSRDLGVWFMDQSAGVPFVTSMVGTGLVAPTVSGYEIYGVGDFGSFDSATQTISSVQDGKADIVWQTTDGIEAIWIMDGITYKQGYGIDYGTGDGWRVTTVGDFGTSPSDPTPDGRPDLLLQQVNTALSTVSFAIRYMNGLSSAGIGDVVRHSGAGGGIFTTLEKDFEVVGAGDYYGSDGKTDILFRHATDGRMFVLPLTGRTCWLQINPPPIPNGTVFQPVDPITWDPDWRVATQELTNSLWRLRPVPTPSGQPSIQFTTDALIPRITLNIVNHPPLQQGQTVTIQRREAGIGGYDVIQSGTNSTSLTYVDNAVTRGVLYEYIVQVVQFGGGGPVMLGSAAVGMGSVAGRGRVLLVIESGLSADPQFLTALETLKYDLAGDGWKIAIKSDAGRNDEPNWTPANTTRVADIKNWIKVRYLEADSAKAVLLIGHVAVPYSGNAADDGHSDHANPWSADLYYGDAFGPDWTLNSDGQFVNNTSPSPVELAVGRIDFAKLPTFGNPQSGTWTAKERDLIVQYINKAHRYRHNIAPFPLPNRLMFTFYFQDESNRAHWERSARILFGDPDVSTIVAEPFRNSPSFRNSAGPTASLIAHTSGGGGDNEIYNLGFQTIDGLTLQSSLLSGNQEPRSAIWFPWGSYFADHNRNQDNLCRSLLAKPDYAVIVMPSSQLTGQPRWKMDLLAVGGTFGEMLLITGETRRWLNIAGDCTLRINVLNPPTPLAPILVVGSNITLKWNSNESGVSYLVYGGGAIENGFTLLTPNDPVTGPTGSDWQKTIPHQYARYMVRAFKSASTSVGSFTNLSQGTFYQP